MTFRVCGRCADVYSLTNLTDIPALTVVPRIKDPVVPLRLPDPRHSAAALWLRYRATSSGESREPETQNQTRREGPDNAVASAVIAVRHHHGHSIPQHEALRHLRSRHLEGASRPYYDGVLGCSSELVRLRVWGSECSSGPYGALGPVERRPRERATAVL